MTRRREAAYIAFAWVVGLALVCALAYALGPDPAMGGY